MKDAYLTFELTTALQAINFAGVLAKCRLHLMKPSALDALLRLHFCAGSMTDYIINECFNILS